MSTQDFTYTPDHPGPRTWRFAIRASLSEERKQRAIVMARALYQKRFHIPASTYEEVSFVQMNLTCALRGMSCAGMKVA